MCAPCGQHLFTHSAELAGITKVCVGLRAVLGCCGWVSECVSGSVAYLVIERCAYLLTNICTFFDQTRNRSLTDFTFEKYICLTECTDSRKKRLFRRFSVRVGG